MAAERRTHRVNVRDVALDKFAIPNGFAVTRRQVVEHHDAVTGSVERSCGVAADVSGAASDQDCEPLSVQWRSM